MNFLRGEKRKQALLGVTGFVASWDFYGHVSAMFLIQDEIDRQKKEWEKKKACPNQETVHLFNALIYLNTVGAARQAMQKNF